MPLSGEAIRTMNYVDDISTTLRRIIAMSPRLPPEERKQVGEYMRAASPSVADVIAALEAK